MSSEPSEEAARPSASDALARTDLAWRRTGVALIACGLAIAKGVPNQQSLTGRPGLGIAVLVLGAITFLLGLYQARVRQQALRAGPTAASLSDLAPLAIGTTLVALVALVLAAAER